MPDLVKKKSGRGREKKSTRDMISWIVLYSSIDDDKGTTI